MLHKSLGQEVKSDIASGNLKGKDTDTVCVVGLNRLESDWATGASVSTLLENGKRPITS